MTIALAICMTAACSALSGLDDFEVTSGAASAGSGGSGGAMSSSSADSGQGGSGGDPNEDCLDGLDNDDDGNADCADTDCTPVVECVDAAPAGWTAGARVARVPYPASDPPSPCGDGSAPALYYEGPAGPAQCSACDCMFIGAVCTTPELSCYFGSDTCSGAPDAIYQGLDSNCVVNVPAPPSSAVSCRRTEVSQVQNSGTCITAGGAITNPSTWNEEVYLCTTAAATQGGCGSGQVCVAKAPTGYDGAACISRDEEGAGCPAGWIDSEIQAYEGGTDTRACTGCACDVSSVACTGGTLTAYDTDFCGNASAQIDSACEDVSNLSDLGTFSYRGTVGTPTSGTCTQAAPTGAVQPTGAKHLCCRAQIMP